MSVTGIEEMATKRFTLAARVSTNSPASIRPVLEKLFGKPSVKVGSTDDEFLIEVGVDGESAKELNRSLLSVLRKVEKKTRLRSEWTSGDATERFFDYVPKGAIKSRAKG